MVGGGDFGLGLAGHGWWVALQFVDLCLQLGVGLILVVFCIWVVFDGCGVLLVVMGGGHGGFGLWS